jgi:L-alanine-DL-glutamate epimerase-like enolase superfamily enzyme
MKITDITLTVVDLGDLETPFWNSIIRTTGQRRGRIEITTDEGVVGMAPCSASRVARAIILGPLKGKLVGEDPLRIGYLWDKMYMGGTRQSEHRVVLCGSGGERADHGELPHRVQEHPDGAGRLPGGRVYYHERCAGPGHHVG